jgi:hypothetical protein
MLLAAIMVVVGIIVGNVVMGVLLAMVGKRE